MGEGLVGSTGSGIDKGFIGLSKELKKLIMVPVSADPVRNAPVYLLLALAMGVYTYLALGSSRLPSVSHDQTLFYTRYALETGINFGLCLAVVDFLVFAFRRDRYSLLRFWGIALAAFVVGLAIQYTFVFNRIETYFPKLVLFYERYPGTRPSFFRLGWFMIQGWVGAMIVSSMWLVVRVRTSSKDLAEPDSLTTGQTETGTDRETDPETADRLGLDPRTISHATVEDHYCRIYFSDQGGSNQVYLKMSLKELAESVPKGEFLRVHRSHLVNLKRIKGMKSRDRGKVLILSPGDFEVPVSRRRLPQVRRLMTTLSGPPDRDLDLADPARPSLGRT